MAELHPGLTLFIFLGAVYGLSTAIAVLKAGQFLFGIGYCPKKDCQAPGHPTELRRFLGKVPGLGDLFYCPPCLAFWIAVAISALGLSPASLLTRTVWLAISLDGLMACGVVWLLHAAAECLTDGLKL